MSELPNIIDPDYYEHQIYETSDKHRGIFAIELRGFQDPKLVSAFLGGLMKDYYRFVDLLPVKNDKGEPVFVKFYMLTVEGWRRKRSLAIKFPPKEPPP